MRNTQSGSAFWDHVAQRYAKMALRNPDEYEKTLGLVRVHLGPEDTVLELGCGTGTTALRLADVVRSYVASDYSEQMIAIAQEKRAQAQVEPLTLCVGQIGDGSLPPGPYDAVLAFNLLHLLSNRSAAFDAIAAQLEPGGLFISKTPCLSGLFRLLHPLLFVLRAMGKAPDFRFLSPARLQREITQAGFEIVEAGDYPKRPARRFIVAKKLSRL